MSKVLVLYYSSYGEELHRSKIGRYRVSKRRRS
jgi:hypothetical protein